MVLDRILNLESNRASMKVVLSDFLKQQLSVRQIFNMLDRKLNDINTDAKSSRVEILELLSKIRDIATNAHSGVMRHLIKERIELEMQKQDPIRDSSTVTIKLVESEIYALKSRFNTLEMKVEANLHESFSDNDHTSLQQLQVTCPRGFFVKLEHKLNVFTNKFESGEEGWYTWIYLFSICLIGSMVQGP